jgi:hypothetical protein
MAKTLNFTGPEPACADKSRICCPRTPFFLASAAAELLPNPLSAGQRSQPG